MVFLILRILEKIFIIYFVLYLLIDIGLFLYSFLVFLRGKRKATKDFDWSQHPVSIIVPAYNEEVSIAYCAEMLLSLDYPEYELIIVNDGSSDNTIEKLKNNFSLEFQTARKSPVLNSSEINEVYKARNSNLTVIDKVNGGKADSLNAGINYATGRIFAPLTLIHCWIIRL